MKIRIKALTAEIEIELPDEEKTLAYHTNSSVLPLIESAKKQVIEIEKELHTLNNIS